MFEEIPTLAVIGSCIIILLTIVIYRQIIKPYKQFQLYKRILTSSYTTLVCPYSILGTGMFDRHKQDLQEHNDSNYSYKTTYAHHQVVLSRLAGRTFIDLIDPLLIRELYDKTLDGCYKKCTFIPVVMGIFSLFGNGLVFSEGAQWKNKRKIMSSVFNFDFLKTKIKAISSITQQKIKEVEETEENKGKSSIKIDANNLFQRIFGNVVIKCFFGDIKLQKLQNQQIFMYVNSLIQKMGRRSASAFAFLFPTLTYKYNVRPIDRQVNHMLLMFKQFATNVIKEQVRLFKSNDSKGANKFVGIIEKLVKENQLKEQDEANTDTDKKDYYTINNLIDQFATFFVAGTESTGSMATTLIYLLAKYPEVQAKVRKQIDDVVGDNIEDLTFQQLKELTYLQNVQKETLRMHSPSNGIMPRQVIKDHLIGNIPLKKGMLISVKSKSNHYKEQFYVNPMSFDPDRWNNLDSSKVDPFSYFPFSAGLRNCIGQHLAMIQSKVAIVIILKRYKTITPENLNLRTQMRELQAIERMLTTFQKSE